MKKRKAKGPLTKEQLYTRRHNNTLKILRNVEKALRDIYYCLDSHASSNDTVVSMLTENSNALYNSVKIQKENHIKN